VANQLVAATAAAVRMTLPGAVVVVARMTLRAMSAAGMASMTSFRTCVDHVAQTMHPDRCVAVMAPMIRLDTSVAAAVQTTS
jgi:hypothetical protein